MKRSRPLDVTRDEIRRLRDRARSGELNVSADDAELIGSLAETVALLSEAVETKSTNIRRLLKLFFGAKTESKEKLLGKQKDDDRKPPPNGGASGSGGGSGGKRKGHGRNGADAYTGAERVIVKHPEHQVGDRCPACERGNLRKLEPSRTVRVSANAPATATIYECERLRCSTCNQVFAAPLPGSVEPYKYHRNVGVMIALLKYGSGMPFTRLENLQRMVGVPLPASVQWEQVERTAATMPPVLHALENQAAQGQVVYNDDTGMKVLDLMKQREESDQNESPSEAAAPTSAKPTRRGIFTSGIIARTGEHLVALFRTGHRHAGENIEDILKRRDAHADAPIQMCDALSRNIPKAFKVILANCLTHARRNFADIIDAFPEPCRYVIEQLALVYRNDAHAQQHGMDAHARLAYHQEHSAPVMHEIENWCHAQIDQRLAEPNSSLGKAIVYMINHWKALTLFLREPGAPLDNNICERALKTAILHRKNSMFYKTENGARVGDLFMSLIHTCRLNGVSALHYLQSLTEHADKLAADPEQWLPWSYRDTLARLTRA